MKLESLPRFRLAEFPTPIHHLETLSKAYNETLRQRWQQRPEVNTMRVILQFFQIQSLRFGVWALFQFPVDNPFTTKPL